MDLSNECEKLKNCFSASDIAGQRAMKKKVCELTYPCTNFMCQPPVKFKPKKGAKKSKKGPKCDMHYDPSHWVYVDSSP